MEFLRCFDLVALVDSGDLNTAMPTIDCQLKVVKEKNLEVPESHKNVMGERLPAKETGAAVRKERLPKSS
ncbi:MAG: hypothetical protein AAF519_18570 [Bacteroidota bacterium]